MEKCRLGPGDKISRFLGLVQQRDRDVCRLHSQAAEIAQGGIESAPDLRAKSIEQHLARKTQAKLFWGSPKSRRICEVWFPAGAYVDCTGQNGDIADTSGQRSGAIEQRRKWDDALTRNTAPASFRFSTTTASCLGTNSDRILDPAVVRMPFV